MGKETDVYSWGVLLWEMSSGARAWANLRYAQVGPEELHVLHASCAVLITSCMPRWVQGFWLYARQGLLCCFDDLMHAQVCL